MTTTWYIEDPTELTPWDVYGGFANDATVLLTCGGMAANLPNLIGGANRYFFNRSLAVGREVQDIYYPQIPDPSFFADELTPGLPVDIGVNNLDAAMRSYPEGTKILTVGHSMGGMVIDWWLATKAGEAGAVPPEDVYLLELGCPYRTHGGVFKDFKPAIGAAGLAYTVTDMTVAYDNFSDFPTSPTPTWEALANVAIGFGAPLQHAFGYLDIEQDGPLYRRLQDGNREYVFVPGPPMPFFNYPAGIAAIEASYDRPET